MKRPFYVVLFAALGLVIGAIVAWSTEFAYLTMLDFQSIDDISTTLGYAFGKQDPFNYVYLALVAVGLIVGVVQGLKTWDQVYGDRIIPLRRGNRTVVVILYTTLSLGIIALATVTDVFGFKEIGKQEILVEKKISNGERVTQTSTLYGIVLLDEACDESSVGSTTERQKCPPRPYQTKFALFKNGKVERVVESNENGSFEVVVPSGEYEVRVLPGSKASVNLKDAIVSAEAGEKTKFEVRYIESSENR